MNVHMQGTGEGGSRKRRAHKKSRQGCRNCKLRSVKCDETRPSCKKCITFRVSCNYDLKAPDLQTSFYRTASIKGLQKPSYSTDQALLGRMEVPAYLYPAIIVSDNDSTFQLDRQSLDRLGRFQMRTVLTIGPVKTARMYQNVAIELACSHPYLMHIIQTITAIHDRYLSASPNSRQTATEVYHWSRAAALLNRKLSTPVQSSDLDALWAAASLMGTIAFSSIETSRPEEAWPLRPPEPSDLEWVRMGVGKVAIWNITNPLRPESIFRTIADEDKTGNLSSTTFTSGLLGVPSALTQLCGLDHPLTTDNNPYYTAVHTLLPLLYIECDQSTIIWFILFISHMQPDFQRLLEQKDPRALLLLAYWYAKVCHSLWWLTRRAILECQATCLYLERYHAGETAIQDLLQFPKMRCGLVA